MEITTETLRDVIRDLAEFAPSRFKIEFDTPVVLLGGAWGDVYEDDDYTLIVAEAACREECEAREWWWEVKSLGHRAEQYYIGSVKIDGQKANSDLPEHQCMAATPALALAMALREALQSLHLPY